MNTYTSYTRSVGVVILSNFVYMFFGIVCIGLLMDELPEHEDALVLALFFIISPICYCLSMLTSKSKVAVTLNEQSVDFKVKWRSLAPLQITTIPLSQIQYIQLKNSMMGGSYLLLEIEYGMKIKLYSKQFFFNINNSFYDMFLSLKKAMDEAVATAESIVQPTFTSETHSYAENVVVENVVVESGLEPNFVSQDIETLQSHPSIPHTQKPAFIRQIATTTYFKGNQLACANGAIAWMSITILPLLFVFLDDSWAVSLILFFTFFFVLFLPFSFTLNYFGVGPHYIIIKNHNLFWREKRFYYVELSEIILETDKAGNYRLTIVSANGSRKSYRAPSMWSRHWLEFKNALLQSGVKLQDKNNFEEISKPVHQKYMRIMYTGLAIYAVVTTGLSLAISFMDHSTTAKAVLRGTLYILLFIAAFVVIAYLKIKFSEKYAEAMEKEKNKKA